MPSAEPPLLTERLTKDYGRFRALEGLDLAVAPGEVFGVLGPNGSGKTTALRLVLGFLRPTAGRASVFGHDCWSDGVSARRHVAYLPGELRLYENLSGRQLVQFLGRLRGQVVRQDIDDLARRFDIDLARPLASLSSGMKRKVALLTVLATHARLLIMDEPTNALDPAMRDELLTQVRQARDHGQAVVFSSHVLTEVETACDRVAILRRGRLVHLQEMAQIHEGRRARLRFRDHVPGDLRPPAGVVERHRDGTELVVETTDNLGVLLSWLAGLPLADLRLEPLGLRAVYERYHAGAD
jgi:ABC-2 type transport system ATP-binding protein